MRILVPGLILGRLAVYSCDHVKQYMGTCRFELSILQCTLHVKTFGLLQPYFGHLSCMPVVYVTCYKFQGMLPI